MQSTEPINKFYDELNSYARPDRIKQLESFFKTKGGQYGYGDKFLGIYVPDIRKISKRWFKRLVLNDIQEIISSKIHEHRLCAAIMLVYKFEKADDQEKKRSMIFIWEILILLIAGIL